MNDRFPSTDVAARATADHGESDLRGEQSPEALLPRLSAAFRAVEGVLLDLGIDRPHTLRSPQTVEEALEGAGAMAGTLVVLDPAELRAAEIDLEETVADERAGGTLFVALPNPGEFAARRARYRDLATAATAFAFHDAEKAPVGYGKLHFAPRPKALRGWRMLVADTPGFRVAVVSRPLPAGGFIGLWSGNPDVVNEIAGYLRSQAKAAGHEVPAASPEVPALVGITSERDVWRQATSLRGLREVRETELREIARAAALRGVAMRRERQAALARKGAA
jgi:hypothetical protein